ncbi:MAG TPA: hypothetical protein VMP42_04820 [Actinomycetota bacterium]|nr:hypothetical protein [Actinomycetota bacterium]
MEIARVVGLVLTAAWLVWTLYRHVGTYLARGRVLAVTAPVLARIVTLAGLGVALAAPSRATWSSAGTALGLAFVVRLAQVWIVVGAPLGRVLERAELVLRGMSLSSEVAGRSLVGAGGRLRITVAVPLGRRAQLLRVRSPRGIKKLDLFRANLRKFLLAIGRGEAR